MVCIKSYKHLNLDYFYMIIETKHVNLLVTRLKFYWRNLFSRILILFVTELVFAIININLLLIKFASFQLSNKQVFIIFKLLDVVQHDFIIIFISDNFVTY